MTAQCQVLGRLGRDVEIKPTQNGGNIAFGSVAVDSGFGERKKTTWRKVKCFGKTAENFAKFGKKGMLVFAAGEFDLDEYMPRDGTAPRQAPALNATNISWYTLEQANAHENAFAKQSQTTSSSPTTSSTPGYGAPTTYGHQPRQAQERPPNRTETEEVPF
jgi:single-strand DNA-binding protein